MDSVFVKDISLPTLILDETKCKRNISRIFSKVSAIGIDFRPHFKTHQSKYIGKWFWDLGIRKITVSSLRMAKYFLQSGWNDILIAFPTNLRELDEYLLYANQISLKITISDVAAIEFLAKVLTFPNEIYLEVDVWSMRSGFDIHNLNEIDRALKIISKSKFIKLVGILAHNSDVYNCRSPEEVCESNKKFLSKLFDLKNYLVMKGYNIQLSIGDTPSVSICEDFTGVDELRPGNFVFYDVMQVAIGSCSVDDIAVCLAVPIVAIYPQRNEIVCYGGAIHLSKDYIKIEEMDIFGLVVDIQENTWTNPIEETFVKSLYKEHSVIKTTPEFISQHRVGDLLGILPIHSCLTAEAMKKYLIPNLAWADHL
ncbi:MAG: alanine racemase [Candidatus Kapaibacteriota bacterium]